MMSRACIKSALPTKKCWLALVGEAPGRAEEQAGQPFVGAAGKALRKACHEVAIHFSHVLLTNVFLERPEKNEIVRFFARPSSGHRRNIRVITSLGKGPHGYLAANQGDEIRRLTNEIRRYRPKLIMALGATAIWVLTGALGVEKRRGHFFPCRLPALEGFPVFCSYHPSYSLRDRRKRLRILKGDLAKAWRAAKPPSAQRK